MKNGISKFGWILVAVTTVLVSEAWPSESFGPTGKTDINRFEAALIRRTESAAGKNRPNVTASAPDASVGANKNANKHVQLSGVGDKKSTTGVTESTPGNVVRKVRPSNR